MIAETKLSVSQQDVRSFSVENGEPDWFTELRVQALEKAETVPMPVPDKTKRL